MDAETDTYYSLLEVEASAPAEAIKTAYRRLAREYHPDTLPPQLRESRIGKDAEASLKLINEAYEVLSDPGQRALYDEQLQALGRIKEPPAEFKGPPPPSPAAPSGARPAAPKPRAPSPKSPPSQPGGTTAPPKAGPRLRAGLLLAAAVSVFVFYSRRIRNDQPERKGPETGTVSSKTAPPERVKEIKRLLKLAGARIVTRIPSETTEAPKARGGALPRPREKASPRGKAELPALIPAGDFLMGEFSDKGEPAGLPREIFLNAFYIDRTEVTAGSYRAFAAATGREMAAHPPEWDTDTHPMVDVEWADAAAYCKWAGGRLPAEEEWEKAARAGTAAEYGSGNEESGLDDHAWHNGNSAGKAHPVGLKRPNQYGLYDMYGNVWEWVSGDGPHQYTRGGGWSSSPLDLLRRDWHFPGYRNYDLGFRCVFPVETRKHLI